MKQKIIKAISFLLVVLALGATILAVLNRGEAYSLGGSFPKGLDAYAYLFKIKFVSEYFPNIFWNPLWNSGVPTFTWSYPPLLPILGLLVHRLLGMSYETSLSNIGTLSLVLLGFGAFGIVYETSESWILSLLSVFLLFSLNGTWGWLVDGGNYARVLSMGFWPIFIFFLLGYLKRLIRGQKLKWWWLGAVLSLHFCLVGHLLPGGLALFTGTLLIIFLAGKNRLKYILKILGTGFLLSSYWYIPMFFTGHQAGSFFGAGVNQGAIFPGDFLSLNKIQPFYSWPNLYGYFVIVISIIILVCLFAQLFIKKLDILKWSLKISFTFLVILGGLIFYEVAHLFPWYPDKLFIDGLPALSAFFLTTLFSVLVIGGGMGVVTSIFKQRWIKELLGIIFVIPFLLLLPNIDNARSLAKNFVFDVGDKNAEGKILDNLTPQPAFRKLLLGKTRDNNFRFGTDTAYVSDWWNWEYPDYPQTKDYFAQGVTYPNWQFWMENMIWNENDNYNQTNFLLDWYGVKNFLVAIPHAKTQKFIAKEDDYKKLNCAEISLENSCEFQYLKASPVLSATNQPAILVIGDPNSYETFFRAWSNTGLGSRNVILVKGPKSLTSITEADLKNFSAVFLYGYNDVPLSVGNRLSKYVNQGGGLFIESNRDLEKNYSLPDPFPVGQTEKSVINGSWNFVKGRSVLAEDINWDGFAKPELDGGGWGVSLGGKTKSWAEPVVTSDGKDLFVAGQFGEGRVVWSGINLPFHDLTYKNVEETKLLASLFDWVLNDKGDEQEPDFSPKFINPQNYLLSLNTQARGVLFKESYLSGWQAKVDGQGAKIWRAGPDMMYVGLADLKGQPQTVKFSYNLFGLEKLTMLISFMTLIFIIDFIFGERLISKVVRFKNKNFSEKITKIKEEE